MPVKLYTYSNWFFFISFLSLLFSCSGNHYSFYHYNYEVIALSFHCVRTCCILPSGSFLYHLPSSSIPVITSGRILSWWENSNYIVFIDVPYFLCPIHLSMNRACVFINKVKSCCPRRSPETQPQACTSVWSKMLIDIFRGLILQPLKCEYCLIKLFTESVGNKWCVVFSWPFVNTCRITCS